VKYLGLVIAGLLLAAFVHVAGMSPEQRARILRVTPAVADVRVSAPVAAAGFRTAYAQGCCLDI
jgi:hypothetical protein